jgi:small nuclear ribonucleoprotein (snRNP)-like protein
VIPTTFAGALVLALLVLPGSLGDFLYRSVVGSSWREKDFRAVLRLLAFSVLGLAAYSIIAAQASWPAPEYVAPQTFADGEFVTKLPALSAAYIGHILCSTTIGGLAAFGRAVVSSVLASSSHADAWQHFVDKSVPRHWVIVQLRSGETVAGLLDHADKFVEPQYRDIVLEQPCYLHSGDYQVSSHQHLFILGSEVVSVATVWDGAEPRLVRPGERLFEDQPEQV